MIFVGGLVRSGTTLAQRMLIAHPEICGGPEFHKLVDIVDLRHRMHRAFERGMIQHFCSREDVDRELGYLIERLFRPFVEKSGKPWFSEKTPWNVLIFEDLLDLLPKARCIFCIRDPRASISSMLEVGRKQSRILTAQMPYTMSLTSAIHKAGEVYAAGFHALHSHPDRVFLLRYEDAVRKPEEVSRAICNFLGIEWSPAMIALEETQKELARYADGAWYDTEKLLRGIDTSSLEKWRQAMSPAYQYIISRAFENDDDLREAGYVFSDIRPRLSDRCRYAAWRLLLIARELASTPAHGIKKQLKKFAPIRRLVYAIRK